MVRFSPPLGKKPLWVRFSVGAIAGAVILILVSVFCGGTASAAPSSAFAGKKVTATIEEPWKKMCWGSAHPQVCKDVMDAVSSPDARQMAGTSLGGCIVGAIISGPPGCMGGVASAVVGGLPYDGTWD